jgi:hypothetical protein
VTRSQRDYNIRNEERERARREFFLRYGKCGWCNALPKMPCRDTATNVTGRKIMSRTHTGRPLLEEQ